MSTGGDALGHHHRGTRVYTVAVMGFSFGALGGDTFIWGHTTNTFALNYRVCNRLYQIINT